MRILQVIAILFVFILCQTSNAQVSVMEEGNVTNLMQRFESLNRQNTTVQAWRIQIIATDDRRKMESAISKFQSLYPNLEYDWKHASPYYQVIIGAFEKKEDLQSFLISLKRDFPSSIPVMARIEKSKLI